MITARFRDAVAREAGILLLAMVGLACTSWCGAQSIREINPSRSTLWSANPNGASGGRVNHLGVAPADKKIIYAASEWGGVYKSTDEGQTWIRMDGHHPTATWDVKVSPIDTNRIIATSFYDGRVSSLAGISVSIDGGVNWTHPASATPPSNSCESATRQSEPSAYGVAFDREHPENVYVGTNCGLAISNNGGNTWHYVNPTPADPADTVWSVVVHRGGIVDVCGDDGHRRSTNGGATWSSTNGSGTPLPSGMCSITASPDESYVLFAVVGTTIFESDNGGGNWISDAYPNPAPQGRIPFVKTNARAVNEYDLWFGDTSLFRRSCTTPSPAVPGGSERCQPAATWLGGFTSDRGAHDDMGDLAFDPSSAESSACPMIMSSDGGVFVNSLTTSPDCQTPAWKQPQVTPHGLWAYGMSSAADSRAAYLYFGNQDDGTFASTDAQTGSPTWSNADCCDSFDVTVDTNQVLYTLCCYSVAPGNRLFLRDAGMTGGGEINTYPPGDITGWTHDAVNRFGANQYAVLTSSGVFTTADITANHIAWTRLGTRPANACAVHAAGSVPSFFVESGACNGSEPDQLWRYNGTSGTSTWQRISPPSGFAGFGVLAVDKQNADWIFASVLSTNGLRMVISTNGGTSWNNLSVLDAEMTGNGTYKYRNTLGPTDFTGFNGYAQPTLVAFSPFDTKQLVAAGADSGVFLSNDAGATWTKITDNSGTTSNPQIPRARFASFVKLAGKEIIFVGSQGRGMWEFVPNP